MAKPSEKKLEENFKNFVKIVLSVPQSEIEDQKKAYNERKKSPKPATS